MIIKSKRLIQKYPNRYISSKCFYIKIEQPLIVYKQFPFHNGHMEFNINGNILRLYRRQIIKPINEVYNNSISINTKTIIQSKINHIWRHKQIQIKFVFEKKCSRTVINIFVSNNKCFSFQSKRYCKQSNYTVII